jgi:hypothetical protein
MINSGDAAARGIAAAIIPEALPPLAVVPDISGRWRVNECSGDTPGFLKAMGASFLVRKAFSAAVALLNRGTVKRYYTVRQRGNVFVIVVNDGDRVMQHTERFIAGAGAVQSGNEWKDSIGNASVRVAAAQWEGGALRTEVVYAATSAVAYEAEWRREGDRLQYTMSSGGASIWVLLSYEGEPAAETKSESKIRKSKSEDKMAGPINSEASPDGAASQPSPPPPSPPPSSPGYAAAMEVVATAARTASGREQPFAEGSSMGSEVSGPPQPERAARAGRR